VNEGPQHPLWSRTEPAATGCWEWQGARIGGYGTLRWKGHKWFAHRLAWTLARCPIPPGLFVCHHCDNPSCVRPNHLFLGTPKDNQVDAQRKGRLVRKLTIEAAERREKIRITREFWQERDRGLMVRKRCGNCGERGHNRATCREREAT